MLRALLDIVFPPLCHICREFIPDAGPLHLCTACRAAVRPVSSPLCTVCGVPFATSEGIDHPCGACLTHPRPFTAARAASLFDGPPRELIHRFKYEYRTHLHAPLSLLMADMLTPFATVCGPDLLVPVPLHRRRLRDRGFNQAVLLARPLAKRWGLSLIPDNLRRIRWTAPQINLSAEERERNVRGAFAVADPASLEGKRIMLVDDVYTTGSTVAECSRVLRAAGAAEVFVATVARAA